MLKFQFNIRTRGGQKVDHIAIIESSRESAEQKLRQMYRQCSVLRCDVMEKQDGEKHWHTAASFDETLPGVLRSIKAG